METVVLTALGGHVNDDRSRVRRPILSLEEIDQRLLQLQVNSIEDSTRAGYLTGARDYVLFCVRHNLPLDPTPQTIARYIAYTSQFISSGPKYLTGARHFLADFFPDFDKNRQTAYVRTAIRGAEKLRSKPIARKEPIRLHHLQFLVQRISSYDDLLFATLLSCAVYACHRIGELVFANNKSKLDWRKLIKRSTLRFDDELHRAFYILPYHKADPFYRGTPILHLHHNIASPVDLLHQFVQVRDSRHGARCPLFLKEDGNLPSRSWFEKMFFSLFQRQTYGCHSARAGGATYYASLGLSETVIMALGHWSSESWKDYIRDNPSVRAELELASSRRNTHSHPSS